MATNARVRLLEIEVLTPAPPAALAPATADLQQTLAGATLAASATIGSATIGSAPKAAVVLSLTIEVITRAEPGACHCVITPAPAAVKYLMRRPRRLP